VFLDFIHHAEYFGNLSVERGLGSEEDVAVGVRCLISVIYKLRIGADLVVVAGN